MQRFRTTSVRNAAIAIGVVSLIFLTAIGTFAIYQFRDELRRNNALQEQLLNEYEFSHQMDIALNLQAAEWQNILLRGFDPDAYTFHLERFYEKRREVSEAASQLRLLLVGDAEGLAILDRLEDAHREATLAYRRGLRQINAASLSSVAEADAVVGDPMQPVRAVFTDLHNHLDLRSDTLIEAAAAETRDTLLLILVVVWLAIVAALLAGLAKFNQNVSRPLERAIGAAQKIASGNLDFIIPSAPGGDVGRLLTALESMRRTLAGNTREIQEARQAAEAARDNLEVLVRQRTADLLASEARYRRAAALGNFGHWEWDLEGQKMADCSEGLAAIFETTVAEVLERCSSGQGMIHWVHPDDKVAYADEIARNLNSTATTYFDARIITNKGRVRYVRGARETFVDEDGKTRAVGVLQDITELRIAQQSSAEARKVEAIGRLTGGVAHDMNNILNIILGNLELMEESTEDQGNKTSIKASIRAAERGAQMTHRLLAFARRQPLVPKAVNLAPTLSNISDLLRSVLAENIAIEMVIDGGLWNCEVDANQLETVLLNLATNARDAMPDGGKLTIEAGNSRLDDDYVEMVPEVSAGQYVCISVTDTGTGMAQEVIDSAFEPFFTTKKAGEGTGLGLAMAFGFVKQSGGHIKLYSEPGEGTTVKIYLPRTLKTVKGPEPDRRDAPTAPVADGKTVVLVVEDDDDLRTLFTHQMEALGYAVVAASDGRQAQDILGGDAHIDILLTDVILPGGLGGRDVAELCNRLRPDVPVIYMSGYTRNSILHEGRLDAGVTLLQKPFNKQNLAKVLKRALDGKA